jgi:hypothetical protein
MTQPPQGPYGPGGNQGDPQWGSGPGEPTWGGQPGQQPDWGQPGEPTWGGQPGGQQPNWGQPAQPGGGQPQYEPTSEYRPGDYNPGTNPGQYGGYQQPYGTPPPPGGGPGGPGYGQPPSGPKNSKTPWIIGIAVAAVVVIALGVVLFVVLGGDDEDSKASPTSSVTTTESSETTESSTPSVADAEEQIETAVRTYTTSFTARDWDTAIAVTCGAEEATIEDIQAKNTPTVGMKLNSVTGIDVTGDSAQATVSLTFVNPDDNADLDTNRYTFDMENRSGDWLICSTREI